MPEVNLRFLADIGPGVTWITVFIAVVVGRSAAAGAPIGMPPRIGTSSGSVQLRRPWFSRIVCGAFHAVAMDTLAADPRPGEAAGTP